MHRFILEMIRQQFVSSLAWPYRHKSWKYSNATRRDVCCIRVKDRVRHKRRYCMHISPCAFFKSIPFFILFIFFLFSNQANYGSCMTLVAVTVDITVTTGK